VPPVGNLVAQQAAAKILILYLPTALSNSFRVVLSRKNLDLHRSTQSVPLVGDSDLVALQADAKIILPYLLIAPS
jgi:hypothetical protein